jgi:hypothetical protein
MRNDGSPSNEKLTDQTFSVAHQDDNGFAIYPNPVVQDYLNLSLPAHFALRNARVSIFTIHGKLMTEAIISLHHQRIDIQNFPAGTYVLRYSDDRREISKTFIVK